ncbi:MAG: ATP-binding protein [Candidatus Melainabacteria bacterium]|nr:ATP-binding protein [Candidatus Melainabacteria bacterium]
MSDPKPESDTGIPEQLFKVRSQIEDLTKQYIEKLMDSRASANSHAAMLNAILESVGDGLFVVDKDETIILANREAIRLVGSDIGTLPRRQFLDQYKFFEVDGTTPIAQSAEPYSIALKEGTSVQKEGFVTGPNIGPEGMWLRVNASPVVDQNGAVFGVVTVFHDISETKNLQRQRDSLATLLTHDLKNHLASLEMFLEMFSGTLSNALDKDDSQLLVELRESNKQFLQISNSLIELYRSDLYEVESFRGEIDFVQLLDAAIDLSRPLAVAGNVQLVVKNSQPLKIHGIYSALRQVFHNIVQNAIKVSPPGEAVTVETTSSATHIQVCITDRGSGIDEDLLQTLFDSSRVAANLRIGSSSTGFGLYLSRMILEAHGGNLSCNSTVGAETTFTVVLPI